MSDDKPQSSFTEKLTAYLDGELPEAASREVEQALSNDSAVRAEAEKLSRVWELLDLLPRPNASSTFSSRTLATLKAGDIPPANTRSGDAATQIAPEVSVPRSWRSRRMMIWAAGLLGVAFVGFASGRRDSQMQSGQTLEDLPVIEHLDLLLEIGDAEFLRDLHRKGLLHDHAPRDNR